MRAGKPSSKADNDDLLGVVSNDIFGGSLAQEHWKNRRKQAEARSFLDWAERAAPPKEPEPKATSGTADDLMGEVDGVMMPLNVEERQRRLNNADIRKAIEELSVDEPETEFDRTRAALEPYEAQPQEEDDNDEESY